MVKVQHSVFLVFVLLICFLFQCNQINNTTQDNNGQQTDINESDVAQIRSVSVQGESNDYTFSVEVKSPDTGCQQYADWWEVVDMDGNLIYRRILLHSHVNEQPFTRSGGPVDISNTRRVIVRAHMNNTGYSSAVMTGSETSGFEQDSIANDFAENLENTPPLPDGCAF